MNTAHYTAPFAPAGYVAAILATSYLHPLHERALVERELAAKGVRGLVLLDLLLANASASRRYFGLNFDGEAFKGTSFLVAATPELASYSQGVFRACPMLLDTILLVDEKLRKLM
jgi:hypothetical protein